MTDFDWTSAASYLLYISSLRSTCILRVPKVFVCPLPCPLAGMMGVCWFSWVLSETLSANAATARAGWHTGDRSVDGGNANWIAPRCNATYGRSLRVSSCFFFSFFGSMRIGQRREEEKANTAAHGLTCVRYHVLPSPFFKINPYFLDPRRRFAGASRSRVKRVMAQRCGVPAHPSPPNEHRSTHRPANTGCVPASLRALSPRLSVLLLCRWRMHVRFHAPCLVHKLLLYGFFTSSLFFRLSLASSPASLDPRDRHCRLPRPQKRTKQRGPSSVP